jgi:hypothetical protein
MWKDPNTATSTRRAIKPFFSKMLTATNGRSAAPTPACAERGVSEPFVLRCDNDATNEQGLRSKNTVIIEILIALIEHLWKCASEVTAH